MELECEAQAALVRALGLALTPTSETFRDRSELSAWLPLPGRRAAPVPPGGGAGAVATEPMGASLGVTEEGWMAYRRNAAAIAHRALSGAYPVLTQMLGEEAMAALAWQLWRRDPPVLGDLGAWGGALAALIETLPALADEPAVSDMARLEWAVHEAGGAADASEQGVELDLLARLPPERVVLRFQPGFAVLASPHPVVSIWRAHQPGGHEVSAAQAGTPALSPWDEARAKLALGLGEAALVRRSGWRVQVEELTAEDAAFTAALLRGDCLGAALEGTPPTAFEPWLVRALREAWLSGIADLALLHSEMDP